MYETFVYWNYIYIVKSFYQKCYEHNNILERGGLKYRLNWTFTPTWYRYKKMQFYEIISWENAMISMKNVMKRYQVFLKILKRLKTIKKIFVFAAKFKIIWKKWKYSIEWGESKLVKNWSVQSIVGDSTID